MKEIRWRGFLILMYRLLVYFFYQIARFLFWFNRDLLKIDSVGVILKIAYHGTAFDTTAILYVNSVFILLSLIPIIVNSKADIKSFILVVFYHKWDCIFFQFWRFCLFQI